MTVLVPTYNHEPLIGDCLRGILTQRFSQRFHVVVYDDASTDGTADVVRDVVSRYPDQVHAVLYEENQYGHGRRAPWIDTLVAPVTPYVAFCDGDDEWIDETKLERQWRFMQRNPWCSLSHHEIEISAVDGAEEYAEGLRRYLRSYRPNRERTPGLVLMDGNWIMTCTTMFRSSALPADLVEVIGNRVPQDFILFALAAERGDIGFLPEAMSRYRLHGSNMWSSTSPEARAAYETESLWFLAAHLTGAARDRIRERLVDTLAAVPDDVAYPPFLRLREVDRGLEYDRAVLLDRVRYLEEREIELVHALGWDEGDR